ncbi:MAG: hypothetical protein LBG52_02460 [Candidatus Peribacteria bacterium]|jgi:calcineurin-like phosphoesterase family protein|nr:hypothetical protein [Candidatus Peribacteria bacterium]
MLRKFFTADWHAGEVLENVPFFPGTHSYLRPQRTDVLIQQWLKECHEKITTEDTLYFLGDLALQLADLEVYQELPPCHKVLIMGDKEYDNKSFTQEAFVEKVKKLQLFDEVIKEDSVIIGDQKWIMAHKPTDCFAVGIPALCGHVHGIWRTQQMANGQPIINVGIDAWHCLVGEEFILHQYDAIIQNYYDRNAKTSLWNE